MTKVLTDELNYENIANAIRSKTGESAAYLPSEMAEAISALLPNRITNGEKIQCYSVSDPILPNTFIELVSNWRSPIACGETATIATDDSSHSASGNFSGVAIAANKIFLAYPYNKTAYAVICTVSGDTITVGTPVALSSGTEYLEDAIMVDYLGSQKVIVSFRENPDDLLKGSVCTISGNNITVGTRQNMLPMTTYTSGNRIKVINSSTVLVTYSVSNYAHACVCAISGNTLTPGTDTQITTQSYSGTVYGIDIVNSSTALITYVANGAPNVVVASISGTTITPGAPLQIAASGYSVGTALLSSDTYVVTYGSGSGSRNHVYVRVGSVSGGTVTLGQEIQLISSSYSGDGLSMVKMNSSSIFLIYRLYESNSSSNLNGVLCTIENGNVRIMRDDTILTGQYSGFVPFRVNDEVAIVTKHAGINNTAFICRSSIVDAAIESQEKIDGVTASTATYSTAGDIWVLNQGS